MNISTIASKHVLMDFYGVQSFKSAQLENLLRGAAKAGNANVLSFHTHPFEGGGETAVVLLSESHITVHTWPEQQFAAFDVYMCGDSDSEDAASWLENNIQAERADIKILERGTSG